MTSTSFPLQFPFVSKPVVSWSQNVPVAEIIEEETNFAVLKPDQDPSSFLEKHSVVYLQPHAVYDWRTVLIRKPTQIHGQGATVRLNGQGPILQIQGEHSIPDDIYVHLENITFVGSDFPSRHERMNKDFQFHSAVWITNAWKTTITQCNFKNFKGAALWYNDTIDYWNSRQWSQQHFITHSRFTGCRIGVANTGGSEYSLCNNNLFFDCQVCFNVIGANWAHNDNVIVNCRCAYLHLGANMWYQGTSRNHNPAKGSFNNNTINHADYGGNLWPTEFVLQNGDTINLAGFYFDDQAELPPTYTGNNQWYGDVNIVNFSTARNDKWCITGCNFYGVTAGQDNAGQVQVSEAVKNKVYFIGCSGNNVILKNVVEENMTPKFGRIQ
ncbi:E1B 55K [Bovine adenovirus 7]|uniref:E1B 55K protein n=1 Tax=Bovine adenovirus 7 TaxID=10511 RepID=A0A7R7FSN3_ADEB7|nr:E1B 55K [Bovine adenovirus 7]URN46024.1 E1B 55K [Bovine adenovirus 7]BCO10919.1 E1B 55K [Bovine adenovirus 7]BCS90512.1 E1B 55K [Bovine adenovirus 7]